MAGDSGIAILGLALLYILSRGKVKNGVNGVSIRRVKRYATEPAWRIPTRELPEEDIIDTSRYPRTIYAPSRPRPAIVTYVSPRTGVTLKKFVTEPAWRIPTRGLVTGAETLGRGEG